VILGSRLYSAHEMEMQRRGVRRALYEYEHELSRICAIMSRTGMVLDQPYTERLRADLIEEEEHYAGVALSLGVENINSTRQLAEAFVSMGETLTERSEKTGNLKVDKAVLLRLADLDGKWKRVGEREPNVLADAVIRSKRAGKWRSAYADNFLDIVDPEGRIHPNINPLQARTGRMSITNPAVQTLPSGEWKIRRCLLADPGHVMISTDFSSVEMRVLAALANVRRMKEAVREGRDLND
ncbi:DNA polymerase, partial [Klebsiella pneumoniae]